MATPGGLRPPNPAALLVRPPPQGALGGGLRPLGKAGPASLLLRPPPSGTDAGAPGAPLTGATGAAALLLRPPPSPTDLSPSPAPGGLRPTGAASLLVRPPPSQSELAGQTSPPGPRPFGAAALLVRPPPNGTVNVSVEQAGAVSSSPLVRPPANDANDASVSPESTTASIWPPPPGAEIKAVTAQAAEDWDGYGPAWDGYGAADEASPTEELEPKSKEADVTDAVDKLPEAAESVPEPRQDQKHIFITSQPGTGKTTLIHKLLQKLTEEDGEGGVDIFGFYTEEVKDPENPKQRLGFDVVRVGEVEEGAPKRAVLARVGQALPKVGKYTVDVAAFEAFALPALEPPKEEIPLPSQPRLYRPLEEAVEEKVVSLLYEPGDDEEGANSRIRLEFGEELNVPPSSLREVPTGWKHPDEEEEPVPRLCVVDEVGKMGLLSVQFPKTLSRVLNTDVVLATGVQTAKGQRDPEAVEDIKKRNGCRVIKLTRNNRDLLVDQTYAQLRESLGLGPPGTGKPRVRTKKKKEEERKAKERAEREAREREEKEREEAAEKEKAARRERQMAKEKARAERLAKERAEREVEAAKARAERKRRAEARKKAMEDAKNGVVPCVEHEDADDVEEMAPSFDLVDDAIEVEEAPRKRRRALSKGGSMASLASPSPGSPEASPMDASPAEASPSSPIEPPAPPPVTGSSMRSLLWESDLLMWKQPAVTGAVFGCFNCFFLAVFYWDLSLVPFICNIFTLVLMAGGAVRYAAPQSSADHSIEILSQDAIKVAVENISKILNVDSQKVRDVVLWTQAEATFMAFGLLQLIRVATPYCSLLPVIWFVGNLLLSVPYACEANREQLEKHCRPYLDKALNFKAELMAKVPKYTDVVKE